MKDFITLKILDRFQFIFRWLKIDYPTLRKILQVKFIQETRRVPTSLGNSPKYKENKNYFFLSLFIYSLMGLFAIVPFILFISNIMAQMTFTFGILMFLIMSTVISDFSSVLLDVRDKTNVLTKPVSPKTLSMAKFIHILYYLFFITFALTAPVIITLFIKYTVTKSVQFSLLFILIFILELILLNLFIIVITTLLYLFILKFFSGEKLKDIINYIQIFMIVVITIGYQLVGRIFQMDSLLNVNFSDKWYQYILIPLWFGSPFELIFNNNFDSNIIILTLLIILVPLISFIIYLRLYKSFEDSLLRLNQGDKKKKVRLKKWTLAKLITSSKEEETFYRFSYQMMKSEREFKLRVYPSLGFSLIFPFFFILQGGVNFSQLAGTKYYLFLYFCAFIMPTAVMMIRYSKSFKGAWIYYVAPIKNHDIINKATLKAFIVRLVLPVYLFESIVFLVLFKLIIIPDLLVIFFTICTFLVICFKLFGRELPFSQSYDNVNKGLGLLIFLLMFILAFLALIHFIFTLFNYGIYVYLVIIIIINFLVWRFSFKRGKKHEVH